MDTILKSLPSILNTFDIKDAYVFSEEDTTYMIIRRNKSISLYDWQMFEDVTKDNCKIEKLFIISYEELTDGLKNELINKSIYVDGGNNNE
jgi:hypothetical protein